MTPTTSNTGSATGWGRVRSRASVIRAAEGIPAGEVLRGQGLIHYRHPPCLHDVLFGQGAAALEAQSDQGHEVARRTGG